MTASLGISDRDRRTLLVGATAVCALLVISRGIPALQRWNELQTSQATAIADVVSRTRSGAATSRSLRDSLAARRALFASLDSSLIIGPTTSSVAAGLSSILEQLAEQNSVRVSTLQMRGDSVPVDGLIRTSVRLTGTTDVAGLAGFLRAVEGGDALLVVRELTVTQPEPAASDAKPEALRVDVVVEALGAVRALDKS